MKELTVVIAVVMLSVGVSCGSVPDREAKANASSVTKDETTPGTPWLPFFGLNPFQSFTLPGLGLALKPNTGPVKIKATKTQYIQVTRRQTVHPVCYTMYENKAPCLPYRSNDEEERDVDMDMDVHHQITLSSKVEENVHSANEMASYMKPVNEVLDGNRNGKYLQFGKRKKEAEVEGSESQRQSTDYVTTTTVILTKLEKYTDHRITATMIAHNCLPVDPAIPRCRRYVVNPIIEVPLHGSLKEGNKNSIIITPVVNLKSEPQDEEIEKTVEAVKKAAEAVRAQAEEQATEVPDTVTAAD